MSRLRAREGLQEFIKELWRNSSDETPVCFIVHVYVGDVQLCLFSPSHVGRCSRSRLGRHVEKVVLSYSLCPTVVLPQRTK